MGVRAVRWWILIGLALTCGSLPAQDLFQAATPVADQSQDERNRAIGAAMEKVLVKITGSRNVTTRPAAKELVREAAGLVQQYRYQALPLDGDNPEQPQEGRLLSVRFDESALRLALRERGLSAWGPPRPSVLAWLGIEQKGRRRFFQPETDAKLLGALDAVSADRGVTFLLPLLDVEDLSRLQPADLWGGFDTRVQEASARYGADVVLVGRLSRAGKSRRIDWQMRQGGGIEDWQSRSADAATAVESGLQEAMDRIAARYAPVETAGDSDSVLVRVRGLGDLDGFIRVDRFLRAVDGVEQSDVMRVEPSEAVFRVRIRGGVEALQRGAELGRMLSPEPLDTTADALGDTLVPDLGFYLLP